MYSLRRHLHFDGDQTQLFERARRAGAAVAYETGGV